MAIYGFDGTMCSPGDLSNVFRMYDAYDSRHKFYATCPGSRGTWLSKGIEGAKHGVKSFNATLYFRSTKTLDRLTRFILWKNFDFSQYTIEKYRK